MAVDCVVLSSFVFILGLPDPPLEVEVAVGHANSLDVNWIPVTITERGTSNGARVTGYKVYINGFPCTEVTSPTADSVTAVSWMVERAFKRSHSEVLCVVVRTQSCEGESVDSNEVELLAEMFDFKVNNLVKPKGAGPLPKRIELTPQSSVEEENSPDIQDKDSAHDSRNAEESRERADSVRRYSRGENGQPHLVIKDDTNRVRNVVQGDTTMAQPRTKGEPVIWKNDNADESEAADSVTKSDERVSDDEDEEIEICIPDASDDLAHSTQKEPDMNAEQLGYKLLEEQKNEDEELEEGKEEEEVMEASSLLLLLMLLLLCFAPLACIPGVSPSDSSVIFGYRIRFREGMKLRITLWSNSLLGYGQREIKFQVHVPG